MLPSGGSEQDCKPGYVFVLGKCRKRFVKPPMKACRGPEEFSRHGRMEVVSDGRIARFHCDEGWMRVPDVDYAMCKVSIGLRTGCCLLCSSLGILSVHAFIRLLVGIASF